jgi:RNA polymerase sigma-70 factor (ECF subfamily)
LSIVQAESDPDVALMLRVKAGDERAFVELFHKHKRKIVSFARRYLSQGARAEDAAQEVFLRIYRARERYEPKSKFTTYLYHVATNTCLNHLRAREFLLRDKGEEAESASDRLPDNSGTSPEADLAGRELEVRINRTLGALPESQRTALLLLRSQDLSYEEIAEVMCTTVPAVKSLLNRAREFMLAELAPWVEKEIAS